MTNLFGEAAQPAQTSSAQPSQPSSQPAQSGASSPSTQAGPAPSQNLQQLVNRAIQEFDDYQRLTAEGKLGEAGQKLEQHRHTLEEIQAHTEPSA